MEEGIYSVDRVEENNVVLQNNENGKIINIELSFDVSDGDVLIYKNNEFIKDENTQKLREKEILEKFNKVKRSKE